MSAVPEATHAAGKCNRPGQAGSTCHRARCGGGARRPPPGAAALAARRRRDRRRLMLRRRWWMRSCRRWPMPTTARAGYGSASNRHRLSACGGGTLYRPPPPPPPPPPMPMPQGLLASCAPCNTRKRDHKCCRLFHYTAFKASTPPPGSHRARLARPRRQAAGGGMGGGAGMTESLKKSWRWNVSLPASQWVKNLPSALSISRFGTFARTNEGTVLDARKHAFH